MVLFYHVAFIPVCRRILNIANLLEASHDPLIADAIFKSSCNYQIRSLLCWDIIHIICSSLRSVVQYTPDVAASDMHYCAYQAHRKVKPGLIFELITGDP